MGVLSLPTFQLLEHQIKLTSNGRPMTWYVNEQVEKSLWFEQVLPAEIVGLTRPLTVFRTPRKTNLITYSWHGDQNTFCPPIWWDLAIGSGACGLGCRACFLMLTHRIRRDPWRHLLYDNLEDFVKISEKWLKDSKRRKQHTLGVGIDRSDSLLYEGITYHVRNLAPIFGDSKLNLLNNKLILLTKTANVHYLAEIRPEYRQNIVVSFSLNPENVADLWEGKWPDTGERITPSISQRLDAAKYAQELGFEIRARIDPILTPENWEDAYEAFIADVNAKGIKFHYWTLGTYREKNIQLDAWRERWDLLPMEWQLDDGELAKDGTHRHLSGERRITIYQILKGLILREFPNANISLCKETHSVRCAVSMCNADCNCLT